MLIDVTSTYLELQSGFLSHINYQAKYDCSTLDKAQQPLDETKDTHEHSRIAKIGQGFAHYMPVHTESALDGFTLMRTFVCITRLNDVASYISCCYMVVIQVSPIILPHAVAMVVLHGHCWHCYLAGFWCNVYWCDVTIFSGN